MYSYTVFSSDPLHNMITWRTVCTFLAPGDLAPAPGERGLRYWGNHVTRYLCSILGYRVTNLQIPNLSLTLQQKIRVINGKKTTFFFKLSFVKNQKCRQKYSLLRLNSLKELAELAADCNPVFKGNLCRNQRRQLQSQGCCCYQHLEKKV